MITVHGDPRPDSARVRVPRAVRLAAGGALIGIGLVAASLAGAAAWTSASSAGRLHTPESVPAHDVAIIFGAQVFDDGTPAPYTANRLDLGVALFAQGKAKVLVVSGDNRAEHNFETTSMRRYLQARGVPTAKIVEDEAGQDSYDTCIRARDTFGVTSAILVSQAYHLPRAITACRALGVDAVGVGDRSVEWTTDFYPIGLTREFPANVKLVKDVLARRPPAVVDPPSSAVRDALAA